MFQYFYHERIRKSVATFGTIFNNIHVQRRGKTGAVVDQVKVPLSYAPKDKIYSPAPYSIFFQLNIYAKLQDDALQIVEQIIPYFNPQYTLTLKPFGEYTDIKEDVPITLQSVSFQDDFEGSLEQRRTIIYTLDFSMKVNFHGPFRNTKIIKKAITDVYLDRDTLLTSGADSDGLYVKHTTTPNPLNAEPFSDFGFTINTEYYGDSSQ